MNKPKFFLSSLVIICAGLTAAFAQNENVKPGDPSREVVLQVLVASNSGARADLPPALAGAVKKLGGIYSFSNYRLAATCMGRVGEGGHLELRGIETDISNQKDKTAFAEWSLYDLRRLPAAGDRADAQIQKLSFGLRVPLIAENAVSNDRQIKPVIEYQNVGLVLGRFGVPEKTPTVIGTIPLAHSGEVLFLVLTVN